MLTREWRGNRPRLSPEGSFGFDRFGPYGSVLNLVSVPIGASVLIKVSVLKGYFSSFLPVLSDFWPS